jgi:general secretion pathway protein D
VTATDQPANSASRSDLVAHIREVDLAPRFPRTAKSTDNTGASKQREENYYGDDSAPIAMTRPKSKGASKGADPATTGSVPEKGYELNFENTPIATVTKAILGDILHTGYTIDPRVQGTVSLSSGRPVPQRDLLYTFESALHVSNVAMVPDGAGYRLVPSSEAVGAGTVDGASQPEAGFGISVVPLQNVSAQTLSKLLENFAARPGMVRADLSRNLILIQGSGADRRAAIDTVLNFDADWMRGQSVGIYPVTNSTPEPIIHELERIIDTGEGGLSQSVVKLLPIGRQNAVLVVTRRPQLLRTVATWIRRLDKSGNAGTGVKVYRMRYGDARQTAALLNDIFLGSTGMSDASMNQLAPAGGAFATGSDRSNPPNQQRSPLTNVSSTSPNTPASFNDRFADAGGTRVPPAGAGPPGTTSVRNSVGGVGGPGPLLPNVRIAADTVNNALLIYASQENYQLIERTLQQLDRPQLQVAIDATIAEITLNDDLRYGVQFFLSSKDVGLPPNTGSILNTAGSAVLSRVLPGFNFLVGTETQPRVILDALHAVTDVKILSTPSVVVVDNQFASLLVGDQIPVTTRTAQSVDVPTAPVVNSIDYRNTGVILRVAPRVNANGNVLLDVEQEISAVANNANADTLTPTISQRKVKSTIGVASGQTVLLGGLISERQDRGRRGVPGLDQVPFVGEFFSRNSGSRQRTELIIFIRPQIIRNGVDASRIAHELRAKMQNRPGPAPCCASR